MATLPPKFAKVPQRELFDRTIERMAILTYSRIIALAWDNDYKHTEPMMPDELMELLQLNRATYYRHMKLLRDRNWIEIVHHGKGRVSIRILIEIPMVDRTGQAIRPLAEVLTAASADNHTALQAVLVEAGIVGKAQRQILGMNVDPCIVRAWMLWCEDEEQEDWRPGTGYIITRLLNGDEPLPEYLRMARDGVTSLAELRAAEAAEQARLDAELRAEIAAERAEREAAERAAEPIIDGQPASIIWGNILGTLQLSMTRATFDTWLRGSRVVAFEPGAGTGGADLITVYVRVSYAADWLANRLHPTIIKCVSLALHRDEKTIEIHYTTDSQNR